MIDGELCSSSGVAGNCARQNYHAVTVQYKQRRQGDAEGIRSILRMEVARLGEIAPASGAWVH